MKELSLHILDIVENSLTAKATSISISINENSVSNSYEIRIGDNGTGMDAETLNKVNDPFFTTRTTRKVGMGISLFKQAAEQCQGSLHIQSQLHKGTEVTIKMQHNHLDRQPLGDITGVLVQLFSLHSGVSFKYTHVTPAGRYEFDTTDIKNILGDLESINYEIRHFLKQMIQENLEDIEASK